MNENHASAQNLHPYPIGKEACHEIGCGCKSCMEKGLSPLAFNFKIRIRALGLNMKDGVWNSGFAIQDLGVEFR
jgi:hypothetical protein